MSTEMSLKSRKKKKPSRKVLPMENKIHFLAKWDAGLLFYSNIELL